jgi:hypothetical protein
MDFPRVARLLMDAMKNNQIIYAGVESDCDWFRASVAVKFNEFDVGHFLLFFAGDEVKECVFKHFLPNAVAILKEKGVI